VQVQQVEMVHVMAIVAEYFARNLLQVGPVAVVAVVAVEQQQAQQVLA
jgi:hypothetical protein